MVPLDDDGDGVVLFITFFFIEKSVFIDLNVFFGLQEVKREIFQYSGDVHLRFFNNFLYKGLIIKLITLHGFVKE